MRSLSLGEAFALAGWQVVFYATVPPFVADRFQTFTVVPPGHPEHDLMLDWADPSWLDCVRAADVVVGDLYALTEAWQRRCRAESPAKLVMISDPPLSGMACDLLVLPTVFEAVPLPANAFCRAVLSAPEHCLIGRAIGEKRSGPKRGDRLLISCGGGEDLGLAARYLRALAADESLRAVAGTVVLGLLRPEARAEALAAAAALPNIEVREQVSDMASLIAAHDWALGTPAGAALERACLGLAQFLVPIVDNQQALGRGLARRGLAEVFDAPNDQVGNDAALHGAIKAFFTARGRRSAMAETAYRVMDGRGAASVVYALTTTFFSSDDGQRSHGF